MCDEAMLERSESVVSTVQVWVLEELRNVLAVAPIVQDYGFKLTHRPLSSSFLWFIFTNL